MTPPLRFRLPVLIAAAAILAAVTLPLSAQEDSAESTPAQSYANNEFQLLSRRYIRWAEEAFNNGDYDASIEYSALAQENADLSDAFVQKMLERGVAQKMILRASTRLAWAEKNTVSVQSPDALPGAAADGADESGDTGDSTEDEEEAIAFDSPAAVFAAAKEALALARAAFDSEAFDNAADHAQIALDALAWLRPTPDDLRPWRIGDPGLPRYYVVHLWTDTGDCFWNIAGKPFIYGNPRQWRPLYNANRDLLPSPGNPNRIAPGTVLEIPERPGETRTGTYDSAR